MSTNPGHKERSDGPDYDLSRPLVSYLDIAIGILKDPKAFFSRLDPNGGLKEPTLYTLASYLAATIGMSVSIGSAIGLSLLPMITISWFIFISLVHLATTKLLGGQGSFRATYRVAAYCNFTYLISFIPYLGLGAQIFGLWLVAHGLAEVHRMSLIRALAALGVVFAGQLLLFFALTQGSAFGL